MKFREQFVSAFESIFLALFMVSTVAIAVSLVSPPSQQIPNGTVEIYSLTATNEPV